MPQASEIDDICAKLAATFSVVAAKGATIDDFPKLLAAIENARLRIAEIAGR